MSEGSSGMLGDESAREQALDPALSFIVQAPAGSGKTELLTQRYLRLLATVDDPEQVLAITFTRKAAAEMQARIVKALQGAAEEVAPDAPHARKTWRLARAVRAIDAERGWNLTHHPARLRIQTIDALTGMLARRLPILSGTGAALEPIDDATPLYRAASERLLETLGDGSNEAEKLETLISHLGNQVDQLLELMIDLLQRRDQWLHALVQARASADLRKVVERALSAVVARHLEDLCRTLPSEARLEAWALTRYAAENLLANPALNENRRALLQACLDAREPPGADTTSFESWRALADVFLNKSSGAPYRSVTVTQGFPPANQAAKARMKQLLAEMAEDALLCEQLRALGTLPSLSYSDEQWCVLEALFAVLPLAVAELRVVFQQQRRADFVESSLSALRALGAAEEPTDLALAFDYRLRHILVDEFQDTSFTQLDLLERLTAGWMPGDGHTLFCVGDPMQSIYRFRQAEVGLFLQLQRQGLKHLPLQSLTLTANFRSTAPLVDWVNRIFPHVLPPHDDIEQGAVKYSPSTAAKRAEEGGVRAHPGIEASALQTAETVVQIVQRALRRDTQGTVAILVAARSHVGLIATQLHAAGIEHQAVEIELLSDRPVVQDLIALTRALVHLADRTAWLAILRAPWCGLTLADLHALAAAEPRATVWSLLHRAVCPDTSTDAESERTIALSADGCERARRLHRVVEQALQTRARSSLRDWMERTWISLGGPATLNEPQDIENARAYFRRLDEFDEAGDLADVTRLEEQLQGLCARPRAGASARVEIMTIHKAKGLEFDTVILPGLESCASGDSRSLLHWTRVAGLDDGLVFAPLTAAGAQADPVYRWVELLEKQRTEQERARLLYVAATRAKRELHLLGTLGVSEKPEGPQLRAPRKGSMLALLWAELEPDYQRALEAHTSTARGGGAVFRSVPLRRLPLDWKPAVADADVEMPPVRSIAALEGARPEFDWVTETSRRIGTLVHRELERLVSRGRNELDALGSQRTRARMLAELAELGVPSERCEPALQRVVDAIERALADPRGRWLLGLQGRIREAESELALSGLIDGQLVQGVIDRTFIDEQGVRWIVDFKTSAHEGAGLDLFLAQEADRYRPQLMRYAQLMRAFKPAEPIKAALYFPLLKQWREVAVGVDERMAVES